MKKKVEKGKKNKREKHKTNSEVGNISFDITFRGFKHSDWK